MVIGITAVVLTGGAIFLLHGGTTNVTTPPDPCEVNYPFLMDCFTKANICPNTATDTFIKGND